MLCPLAQQNHGAARIRDWALCYFQPLLKPGARPADESSTLNPDMVTHVAEGTELPRTWESMAAPRQVWLTCLPPAPDLIKHAYSAQLGPDLYLTSTVTAASVRAVADIFGCSPE